MFYSFMGAVLVLQRTMFEKLLIKNGNNFSRTVAHHIKFQRKHKERNRLLEVSTAPHRKRDGAKAADYCALLSIGQP